jgi:hypothetical protein
MFDNLKKCLFYILSSNVAEITPFILFLVAQVPFYRGEISCALLVLLNNEKIWS